MPLPTSTAQGLFRATDPDQAVTGHIQTTNDPETRSVRMGGLSGLSSAAPG